MVSKLDIGRWASENTEPVRWVDCEITRRLERETKRFLQECENLSLVDVF